MDLRLLSTSLILALVLTGLLIVPAEGQLQPELKNIFESMLEDLDKDLRLKFEKALKSGSPEIEFTADQFRRFKNNPINPFEGIQEIDPDEIDGKVILKFELPSLRNRRKSSLERQSSSNLRLLQRVIGNASESTVSIRENRQPLVLGIVVDRRGLVLTKASEIDDVDDLRCKLPNGKTVVARVLKINKRNDLALLRVAANDLTPVEWSERQPRLGTFVVTPNQAEEVVCIGSYSVTPRSTVNGQLAFLGVRPEATTQGIRIDEVTPNTAAYDAGLKNGDLITHFQGVRMLEVSDLVNIIRRHSPGDDVSIEYVRGGQMFKTQANLAGRNLSGRRAAEFKMMNRLGAIPSKRSDGFPSVFQHDSPLFPEQCGGPVVDLQGNVIGMNIARNGRAASYAIPASHLKTVLADMLREDVASSAESRQ